MTCAHRYVTNSLCQDCLADLTDTQRAGEELQWLLENACQVTLEGNEHRVGYESVEKALAQLQEDDSESADYAEIDRCILEKNCLVRMQVYVNTPIGFIAGRHYDAVALIHEMYELCRCRVDPDASWRKR